MTMVITVCGIMMMGMTIRVMPNHTLQEAQHIGGRKNCPGNCQKANHNTLLERTQQNQKLSNKTVGARKSQ